jgi:C-methyltransferase C-terminal domain/Putative zinc binding domain/Methyltransferase domain
MHHAHRACRSCGQIGLTPVVSLGQTPLARGLLSADELDRQEATYPLDLVVCPSCALVQITETAAEATWCGAAASHEASPEPVIDDARELAAETIGRRELNCRDLVVQVASGDGYLLRHYQRADVPVLGIEGSATVAYTVQRELGIPTLAGRFSRDLALRLEACGQPADVVHVHHALAGVADLSGFVAGLHMLLKPEGVAIVEVPYVRDMVEKVEFDTIYHEHLCYFSLLSLVALFGRHGLVVTDVERRPAGGGSLRIVAARQGTASEAVGRLMAEERALGLDRAEYYRAFGRRVDGLRAELKALLGKLKAQGCRIVAYGASAKESGLLNACGIGREMIDFVVDRSAGKQGRYTPGAHLAIHSPDKLTETRPDYALLLDWNSADEILARHERYRESGGHFIIPIPQLRVA